MRHLLFSLFLLVVLVGCKKEESTNVTQVVSLTNPVQGSWQLKSIRMSEDPAPPAAYGRPEWRTFLINSGVLTTFGSAALTFSERTFTINGTINTSLSTYFPRGLIGSGSGKYIVYFPQNVIEFNLDSYSPQVMFQENSFPGIRGDFSVNNNELTMNLPIHRSLYASPTPYQWNENYVLVWQK